MDARSSAEKQPRITLAITTKDRREDLRVALRSASEQAGAVELLVLDDGSSDGTAEMVAAEFPHARLERYARSAGLVVRRNDAVRLASAPVVASIDDDAAFSAVDVLLRTLEDFDDPRIAVVAMPYVDVRHGPQEHQRPPDANGRWVAPTFRGTAYAVRRDAFLAVGGFRAAIRHQGEEPDLALRLLAAGLVVRLGRAAPIHHFESADRNLHRMDVYGRRNELLLCWTRYPAPWHLLAGAGYAVKGMILGVRVGRPRAMATGIAMGVRDCVRLRAGRRPVTHAVFRLDRRLRRAGTLPLDVVAPDLPGHATLGR